MLELRKHTGGTLVRVKARAGGRTNGIIGVRQGELLVSVTQTPEKGKANQAIQAVLSKALNCGKRQIELVRGATSPNKLFLLANIAPQDAQTRLDAHI